MSFIIIFVLVCIAFPVSVEVARNGKDNVLVRSTSQATILVLETTKKAVGDIGIKRTKFVKPILNIFSNCFYSTTEYVKLALELAIGIFVLYIILQLVIGILGILLSVISWLF